jgi:hypothetical protein
VAAVAVAVAAAAAAAEAAGAAAKAAEAAVAAAARALRAARATVLRARARVRDPRVAVDVARAREARLPASSMATWRILPAALRHGLIARPGAMTYFTDPHEGGERVSRRSW